MNFWNETTPDRVAVIDVNGTSYTVRELTERAHRTAHLLRESGLRDGDTVAVMLSNRMEVLELYLAATEIGLYYMPINRRLLAADIGYLLTDSGSRALITERAHADVCTAGADRAGLDPAARFAVDDHDSFVPFGARRDAMPATPPPDRRAGRYLGYTSGTTGFPKGVRHALGDELPEDVEYPNPFGVSLRPGPHLVACPLYHTGPLVAAVNWLHNGQPLVLMGRWQPEDHLAAVQRHRVVSTTMVPTQFVRLLKLPAEVREAYDQSTLEMVAHMGAPCPVEVKRRMIDWLGPVLYESYGATEGWGLMVDSEEWLRKPGTIGRRFMPNSEVLVLDEDGRPTPRGEVGVIYFRTPTRWSYLNDPEKTAKAFLGDVFTVGDLGYQDEDGFFFLVSRRSDLIVSGGVNIYPAQIEAALVLHPQVVDVAVFGVPNEEWGQEVKAVLELEPAAPVDEAVASVERFARERLASYLVPRSFDVVERLPRDANGKLYKRELSDPYWADTDARPARVGRTAETVR